MQRSREEIVQNRKTEFFFKPKMELESFLYAQVQKGLFSEWDFFPSGNGWLKDLFSLCVWIPREIPGVCAEFIASRFKSADFDCRVRIPAFADHDLMATFFQELLVLVFPNLAHVPIDYRLVWYDSTGSRDAIPYSSYELKFCVGNVTLRTGPTMRLRVTESITPSKFNYHMHLTAAYDWIDDRVKDRKVLFQSLYLSVFMGLHPRLGQTCLFQSVEPEVLWKICMFAVQEHRAYYDAAEFTPYPRSLSPDLG